MPNGDLPSSSEPALSPVEPGLEFLARCEAELHPSLEVGETQWGRRRVIPIAGGRFVGPLVTADVLPGGADWQVVHEGGWASIHARYTLRTDDGVLIVVESRGTRDGPPDVLARLGRGELVNPAEYYFRTALSFETEAASPYSWLTRIVGLASGIRLASTVVYDAYVVR